MTEPTYEELIDMGENPSETEITVWYGRIPAYRGYKKKSWGFAFSQQAGAYIGCRHYTCSRPNAKNLFWKKMVPWIEKKGFKANLIVTVESGLNPDLSRIRTD